MTGASDTDVLVAAEQAASEVGLLPGGASEASDDKALLLQWFMSVNRSTRRAAAFGRKTIGHVAGTVNNGVRKTMPLLAFIMGATIVSLALSGVFALSAWGLTAAFAIHPIVGWALVGLTLITCMRVAVDGLTRLFGYAFA